MKKYIILLISVYLINAQSSSDLFSDLTFRNIGPSVAGGRIHDVEVMPGNPEMLFIASASGGIWKSTNKGTTWKPVFDNEAVSTFGDIAISKSNTNILYVGTGEQQNRQSSSWGNGVYKSTDQGETWQSIGLEKTFHISKVIVHPLIQILFTLELWVTYGKNLKKEEFIKLLMEEKAGRKFYM